MKSPLPDRRPAFTLIEVLTVVAIIAMLAALGFAGLRYAQNKSREKETVSMIMDLTKNLEEYRLDMGNYPRAAREEETTTVDSESYKIGAAKMLYQVMTGDGDDAVMGGTQVPTGVQGSLQTEKEQGFRGKIYMDTIIAPTKEEITEKKKAKYVESSGEGSYFLIDPWRHPFQYQLPEKDKNGLAKSDVKMHSGANYELWSYGKLKKPEDTDEAVKEWIASWNVK